MGPGRRSRQRLQGGLQRAPRDGISEPTEGQLHQREQVVCGHRSPIRCFEDKNGRQCKHRGFTVPITESPRFSDLCKMRVARALEPPLHIRERSLDALVAWLKGAAQRQCCSHENVSAPTIQTQDPILECVVGGRGSPHYLSRAHMSTVRRERKLLGIQLPYAHSLLQKGDLVLNGARLSPASLGLPELGVAHDSPSICTLHEQTPTQRRVPAPAPTINRGSQRSRCLS